jgi:phosphoserine phosphatase RsbU/P
MNEHSFFSRYPSSEDSPFQRESSTLMPDSEDLETAECIQSRLFPSRMPHLDGLDYHGECRPAGRLGGDFFDFVLLPENVLAASIGDVSGHGISAAIMMSGMQAFLRGLTAHRGGLATRVVDELNQAVYQTSPDNFYATLFYAQIEAARHEMRYVSAGHEPALLIRAKTGEVQSLDSTGTVLGLTPRSVYRQRIISIEPGDVFVAFTDGITDTVDPEGNELGQQGLIRILKDCAHARASDIASRIVAEVDRFSDYQKPMDDRTTVVIRFGKRESQGISIEQSRELAFAAA